MLGEHIPREAGVTLERSSWLMPGLAWQRSHSRNVNAAHCFQVFGLARQELRKDVNDNRFDSARG